MILSMNIIDDIADTCAGTQVSVGHDLLLKKLARILPQLSFQHVLTRGGWHRTGGILDKDGNRVADNLREWVETRSAGDVNNLLDQYVDAGYIATRFKGQTLYFVAQTGESAQDFLQLEVEELQEVTGHSLLDTEVIPDNIEGIIDPANVVRLSPQPVGEPRYVFRRITPVAEFMHIMSQHMLNRGNKYTFLKRFMQDWDHSSSHESGPFCHHWVLSLQEYTDAYGEPVLQAKPVSTFNGEVPLMKLNGVHRGSRLANLVHGFDHDMGYPMAWYFYMLSHSEVPHQLAESIHRDLMGAYDYLPARDLKILKDWSAKPYGV